MQTQKRKKGCTKVMVRKGGERHWKGHVLTYTAKILLLVLVVWCFSCCNQYPVTCDDDDTSIFLIWQRDYYMDKKIAPLFIKVRQFYSICLVNAARSVSTLSMQIFIYKEKVQCYILYKASGGESILSGCLVRVFDSYYYELFISKQLLSWMLVTNL